MADLSGMPKESEGRSSSGSSCPIDRDNFNDVMARAAPRVAFRVAEQGRRQARTNCSTSS